MKRMWTMLIVLYAAMTGCAQPEKKAERQVGDACEACDLMYKGMPAAPSWQIPLVTAGESGEHLVIHGTIFKKDGITPAPGVTLYVYQTNNKGEYSPSFGQIHALRHGHIRGWMRTDERGRYEFKTIRPGSYPASKNPQHIHPIIKEPGLGLYWIDEFVFEDDPLLTTLEKSKAQDRGGSGVIRLTKNGAGAWEGKRDIILGMNIPNY